MKRTVIGFSEAKKLCDELMARHGLEGWRTIFIDAYRKLGHCNYRTKEIALSRDLVNYRTRAAVKQTILHEIAHALVGPNVTSHGREWKEAAYDIGYRGRQVASVAAHRTAESKKAKKADVDIQVVRFNRTKASIARWETKLKRAQTALKKLKVKERYYERALAAKRGGSK